MPKTASKRDTFRTVKTPSSTTVIRKGSKYDKVFKGEHKTASEGLKKSHPEVSKAGRNRIANTLGVGTVAGKINFKAKQAKKGKK